jgi:uncharacterized protein (TIGR03067 family)
MKSTSRPLTVFLLITLAVVARAADDLKAMAGTWRPTKAELAGQPMPAPILKSITLKIDGPNYEVVVVTPNGPSPDKGTLALEPTATPKGMTITGVSGPNAGKTIPAIYEFIGAHLRICYDLSGGGRPPEFKTAAGTKFYLVEYELVK